MIWESFEQVHVEQEHVRRIERLEISVFINENLIFALFIIKMAPDYELRLSDV